VSLLLAACSIRVPTSSLSSLKLMIRTGLKECACVACELFAEQERVFVRNKVFQPNLSLYLAATFVMPR
jgi:hypothetical protein